MNINVMSPARSSHGPACLSGSPMQGSGGFARTMKPSRVPLTHINDSRVKMLGLEMAKRAVLSSGRRNVIDWRGKEVHGDVEGGVAG